MLITWYYAVKIENFGIVDAVWSFCFLIHAALFYWLSEGLVGRKLLLLLMLGFWSFRLGFYLAKRIASHHPDEDTRYIKLRADYGANYKKRFLLFFFYQAISVSFLTLPFVFAFQNTSAEVSILEWLGFAVWALSLLGESIADYQMNSFRSNPANKGKVCNVGLWNYSRHPNYFFESCIWWGYFIFMLATPGLIWSIYAPLTMLLLLVKVTGVPPSEAQSLKSRGDAYRKYQERTSLFIPWFPKK
jgi:steroid 5-alpha reductase family enzyme